MDNYLEDKEMTESQHHKLKVIMKYMVMMAMIRSLVLTEAPLISSMVATAMTSYMVAATKQVHPGTGVISL